jgi:hypothetical protein
MDSCAAPHLASAIRNTLTPLEFGKNRGGICWLTDQVVRRLTDASALPLLPSARRTPRRNLTLQI